MVGLDKEGAGEDRRQVQIPEGGDSGRETEWDGPAAEEERGQQEPVRLGLGRL